MSADEPQDQTFGTFSPQQLIIYKLGKIESTLSELRDAQLSHNASDLIFHTDADKRLKSLERTRAWGYGMVAAISFGITALVNFFIKTIGITHT